MTPGSLVQKFGPGMMLMMTGIGTSHLVTAPVAGAMPGNTTIFRVEFL
jgi:Mn2+/Fe2+ NRAMP family transporter